MLRFGRIIAGAALPSRLTNPAAAGTLSSYAGMAELADAPDLGSGTSVCRFDPCYPHQAPERFGVREFLCKAKGGAPAGTCRSPSSFLTRMFRPFLQNTPPPGPGIFPESAGIPRRSCRQKRRSRRGCSPVPAGCAPARASSPCRRCGSRPPPFDRFALAHSIEDQLGFPRDARFFAAQAPPKKAPAERGPFSIQISRW